jgi:tetratricopeptide (TPR) repeat protein
MSYVISLIVVILSIVFSAFVLSNVLLPFFYTIPQLHKERLKNNLIKKIPISLIIWPPIFYSILFFIGFYFAQKFLPHNRIEIIIGIGLSLFVMILRIGKKNSDMEEDFRRYFKEYLKDENNFANFEDFDKIHKSSYYAPETELKPLIIRAFEKYTINDYRSAIAIYDKILDLNPLLANDLVMRAQCLERLNYNLDAIDDYELAISINDSDGNWFGLLGLIYQKIGNLDKAENFLKLSIDKGWKMYEPNLKMLSFLSSADVRQTLIEKCNKPENLTRRNKKDFEDDLSEIDRKEFNANLIKTIEGVNRGLALDPENAVLKELYNFFYSKLN